MMNLSTLFKRWTLSIALLLSIALTAQAQEPVRATSADDTVPTWVKTFGKQLKASLESPSPTIKRHALQHITYFSSFYGEDIDFSDTVPTLVQMYRRDDDADVRLHALVALYAIGDEDGMQQVRRSMYEQDWPPRLQFVTMAALATYFGPETFDMDEEAANIASRLMVHYTRPQIEVGPLEVVQTNPQQ